MFSPLFICRHWTKIWIEKITKKNFLNRNSSKNVIFLLYHVGKSDKNICTFSLQTDTLLFYLNHNNFQLLFFFCNFFFFSKIMKDKTKWRRITAENQWMASNLIFWFSCCQLIADEDKWFDKPVQLCIFQYWRLQVNNEKARYIYFHDQLSGTSGRSSNKFYPFCSWMSTS